MEVVELRSALLSNAEVFMFLKELEAHRKDPGHGRHHTQFHNEDFQDLKTVEYEVLSCLQKTPCKVQDAPQITSFMDAMTSFDLTKAEKLMLLNLRPKSAVELNVIIEECEDRLTEAQQNALLEVIREKLPYEEEEPEGDPMVE
ncbi:hypothetical protein HK104_010365 [Borealophlyctis nickersoniae]|nr:hypothetical protein HK104_010365 [Borealophlyctis nickersoniae]